MKYMLIKYIKSVHWRVAKRLSHIQDARCLKFKTVKTPAMFIVTHPCQTHFTLTKAAAGRSID